MNACIRCLKPTLDEPKPDGLHFESSSQNTGDSKAVKLRMQEMGHYMNVQASNKENVDFSVDQKRASVVADVVCIGSSVDSHRCDSPHSVSHRRLKSPGREKGPDGLNLLQWDNLKHSIAVFPESEGNWITLSRQSYEAHIEKIRKEYECKIDELRKQLVCCSKYSQGKEALNPEASDQTSDSLAFACNVKSSSEHLVDWTRSPENRAHSKTQLHHMNRIKALEAENRRLSDQLTTAKAMLQEAKSIIFQEIISANEAAAAHKQVAIAHSATPRASGAESAGAGVVEGAALRVSRTAEQAPSLEAAAEGLASRCAAAQEENQRLRASNEGLRGWARNLLESSDLAEVLAHLKSERARLRRGARDQKRVKELTALCTDQRAQIERLHGTVQSLLVAHPGLEYARECIAEQIQVLQSHRKDGCGGAEAGAGGQGALLGGTWSRGH